MPEVVNSVPEQSGTVEPVTPELRADERHRIAVTVLGVVSTVIVLTGQVVSSGRLFAWAGLLLLLQPLIVLADRVDDQQARRRLSVATEVVVGATWGLLTVLALAIDPAWQTLQAAGLVTALVTGISTRSSPVKTPVTFGLPLVITASTGLLLNATAPGHFGVLAIGFAWLLTVAFHREFGAIMRELAATLTTNNNLVADIGAEHERLERAYAELEDANAQLDQLARTDPLTGLANRLMFTERLRASLDLLDEGTATNVGLAYLDLDGFKAVNDGLGHKVGDQLLVAIAKRLGVGTSQQGELLARLGGDELVVLGIDLDPSELGQRLLDAFASPFRIDGRAIAVGTSVGVVVVDSHTDPDAMLRYADAALYRAKSRGGRVYEIFGAQLRRELANRRKDEAELRQAFASGLIKPYLQPIVNLTTGAIVGAESLARWEHPNGVRTAATFIDVLADVGLIDRMSEQFLDQIQQLQASLSAKGVAALKIALNVPPAHLEQLLRRHEGKAGLDAVVIEITEDGAFSNIGRARELLQRARDAGMQVLLDDFGVGFSSLSMATQLPVDGLKIDRSFVADVTTSEAARAVVAAVVQLAEGMSLEVIAEGVESEAQLVLLKRLGVHHAQGYFFSPAVPIPEFERWIHDQVRFATERRADQTTTASQP